MLDERLRSNEAAAFLLINTVSKVFDVLDTVSQCDQVLWVRPTFGPYQVVVYVEGSSPKDLVTFVEELRSQGSIAEMDVRMCKPLPGDEHLQGFTIEQPECAVVLININLREGLETDVVINLRSIHGVKLARALWGPADIIAIVEAAEHEAMRNLICDDIKALKGVESTTTLYCYPDL